MQSSKLQPIVDVLKYWFRPRFVFSGERVRLEPNLKGLMVGKDKRLLAWEEIKELRRYRSIIRGGLEENLGGHHRVKSTFGREIWFDTLSDSLEKEIIEKAGLNKKKMSFWTSEEVYFRK